MFHQDIFYSNSLPIFCHAGRFILHGRKTLCASFYSYWNYFQNAPLEIVCVQQVTMCTYMVQLCSFHWLNRRYICVVFSIHTYVCFQFSQLCDFHWRIWVLETGTSVCFPLTNLVCFIGQSICFPLAHLYTYHSVA